MREMQGQTQECQTVEHLQVPHCVGKFDIFLVILFILKSLVQLKEDFTASLAMYFVIHAHSPHNFTLLLSLSILHSIAGNSHQAVQVQQHTKRKALHGRAFPSDGAGFNPLHQL